MEQNKFVKYHVSCHECGSSDAVSVNEDGSAKCFSCGKFYSNYEDKVTPMEKYKQPTTIVNPHGGIFGKLIDRNITKETAEKYGVKVIYDSNGQMAQHLYPYYINNEQCAIKTRYVKDKRFSFNGSIQGSGLFGQNLFKEGGKYLTITEGECDAMAAFELLGSKWACVSIKRGALSAVKDIKESLEYVESFDNVVLCFDKDKQGQEAAKKVATILKPGKAKIVTLPNGYKDPNDMLKQGKHQDFTRAWWDAKLYTPSGIIKVSDKKYLTLTDKRKRV